MSEVCIEIATKNPSKVKAITEVFKIYFENVSSKGTEVISGVPDQPINEDVFKGAKNRIEFLKKNLEEHNYDYLVSCEGGLINMYGGWYNVQIVTIENKQGEQTTGISQAYPISEEKIPQIIEQGLAKVLDTAFDGKGGMRVLTQNQRTREDFIKESTLMALSGLLNNKTW